MSWFRRKTQVVDAQHLLQEVAVTDQAPTDPGAVSQVGGEVTPSGTPVDFRLTVADVFAIKGRGTVITGQVDAGSISVGADIAISRNGQPIRRTRVTGVEMFRRKLDTAVAGQNVGLLLDQVERSDVVAGDVLTA